MALTPIQKEQNEQLLQAIVDAQFRSVKNRGELIKYMLAFFDQHNICLSKFYTVPPYRRIIDEAIANSIVQNEFKTAQAEITIQGAARQIFALEEEHKQYKQQSPEVNIVPELLSKGYIEPNHYLSHKDLDEFLKFHLGTNPNVELLTGLSVTQDNSGALQEALAYHGNSEKLLIMPLNISHNHWILLYGYPNKREFTLWDPKAGTGSVAAKATVEAAALAAYKTNAKVEHIYAGEQPDGHSCGVRIAQKALQVAGVVTSFTAVPTNDTRRLYQEFVKDVASRTPGLKNMIQEKSDELLAIALQDIYLKDDHISEDQALAKAIETLSKASEAQILQQKPKIASELQAKLNSAAKNAASFFQPKSCRDEVKKDQPIIPQTPSVSAS